MKFRGMSMLLCATSFLSLSAQGQEVSYTQAGSWSCTNGVCPPIKFNKPFGGKPDIALSVTTVPVPPDIPACNEGFCYFPFYGYTVTAKDITTQGFNINAVDNNRARITGYSGNWVAVGPPIVNATVVPKYLVLTIIYAPPGMKGPRGTGAISYQEGSTIGTTTSASNSFKQAYSVSASVNGGYLFDSGGNDLTLTYSRSVTDKQSLDIKISQTGGLRGQGSDTEDGINNDNDAIYLALSPKINVQMGPSVIQWTFAEPSDLRVTHVYAAWLKDPNLFETEAPSIKQLLKDNGISEQDYNAILSRDPLAMGTAVPSSDRYEPRQTFDYVPPHPCDIQPLTTTLTFQSSSTTTSEHIVKDEYQVGVTHHDTVQFGDEDDGLSLTMKLIGTWTWTNESSASHSANTTDTATLTVGGPKCGYNGATRIRVYFDKVYRTYAFGYETEPPVLQGSVAAVSPPPAPNGAAILATPASIPATEVRLVDAHGREQRTFTNATGDWTFVSPVVFPVTVIANGAAQMYQQVSPGGAVTTEALSREKFIRK